MSHIFYKYQGTGNDFVMIDNRKENFPIKDKNYIAFLCNRRMGVGADGLILLENTNDVDFKMVYFNSDGNESTMCGNGGRCLVAFAKYLGVIENAATFTAVDGLHTATIDENNMVCLQMKDVFEIKEKPNYTFLDTGSPHHVQLVEDLEEFDVAKEGAKLRYGLYGEKGSNINFVQPKGDDVFRVRTYERGVEDETLSCGTGVTAVALAMYHTKKSNSKTITLEAEGGKLEVKFEPIAQGYKNVFLQGPTQMIYKGEVECRN